MWSIKMLDIFKVNFSLSCEEFNISICLGNMSTISKVNIMPVNEILLIWHSLPVCGVTISI